MILGLMGPTASGKTALACRLVDAYPFEIISIDAAMVYRGMDIGTAKPTASELAEYPHHLIDICDPSETYSVGRCYDDVLACIDAIQSRGNWPLLVGGTMMYFNAMIRGLSALPPSDERVRAELEAEAAEKGYEALHQRLAAVDPTSAAKIHPNDPQRLIRALELVALSGVSRTEMWASAPRRAFPHQVRWINLVVADRAMLHARIRDRFMTMMDAGFEEEVRSLYQRGDLATDMPSMRSVGYRQLWSYCAGELGLDDAIEKGIIATRQLAKRQITWGRGLVDVVEQVPADIAVSDLQIVGASGR